MKSGCLPYQKLEGSSPSRFILETENSGVIWDGTWIHLFCEAFQGSVYKEQMLHLEEMSGYALFL